MHKSNKTGTRATYFRMFGKLCRAVAALLQRSAAVWTLTTQISNGLLGYISESGSYVAMQIG